ncbi:hypothetical protein PENTCL1PPCAC_17476, partial [Pristionchus entomophagus]
MQFTLVILLLAASSSASPSKRQAQNSYGDEPETPAPSTYSAVNAAPATEYAPAEVSQEAVSAAAPVESSGYRHKRQAQNSYGDEPQTPAPSTYSEATTAAAPEYTPAQVSQEAVSAAAPVESSGYRHKRQAQNTYGDEPQTPVPPTYSDATTAAAPEHTPAQVEQAAVSAPTPVESSGYRQKRQAQNSYGDEPQTPSPFTYNGVNASPAAEYSPVEVSQAAVSAAAPVEASGYRFKREAQNSYGDEPVVPAEVATESPVEEAAPAEEPAPVE